MSQAAAPLYLLHTQPDARLLACGMVGSRQGWREAPYLAVPAEPADIARARVEVEVLPGRSLAILPGRRFDWPALLAACDVFVQPPARRGAMPDLAGMHWAMLFGVPVVSAVLPARELLVDESSALICQTAQQREWAMQIRRIVEDAELRSRLTAEARRRAIDLFSPAESVTELIALYRSCSDVARASCP